jgi:hypothetical protein
MLKLSLGRLCSKFTACSAQKQQLHDELLMKILRGGGGKFNIKGWPCCLAKWDKDKELI